MILKMHIVFSVNIKRRILLMQFKMYSFGHLLFTLLPIICSVVLWYFLKDKKDKQLLVGKIIGWLSLLIIISRNVYILIGSGFSPESIPLQVCHFGNIVIFLSLVYKNKTALTIGFMLNVPAAAISFIFADSLATYDSVFDFLALIYIFGHLTIVLGGIYPFLFNTIKITKNDVIKAVKVVAIIGVVAYAANAYFHTIGFEKINYFYMYDGYGSPLGFIADMFEPITIGKFKFFLPFTFSMIVLGSIVSYLMYFLSTKLSKSKL